MASKDSYTITLKNNTTEKEGIQYLRDQNKRFVLPDLEKRKEILKAFDLPNRYSRTFDMVYIEHPVEDDTDFDVDIKNIVLVELKTTKARLENNPYGFFFGATENEFQLARRLGDQYKFCFVCLHPETESYKLLTLEELEDLIKNKRTQYQINLKNLE